MNMKQKQYIKDQVTVIIPVYNEERFLRQALESVVEQVDYVILGDNASTDGTEAICREFLDKYDHITYFRNTDNLGSCKNSILCAEKVDTEFIFHIGGHDQVPPNYVTTLKKTLIANPDVIYAYADCQIIDCDGNFLSRQEYNNPNAENLYGRMIAPYLADSRSIVRAAEFILYDNPCSILFGLCRTQKVITEWLSARPIAGLDVVTLFNLLLSGKFIHSSDTEFYLRDVHQAWSFVIEEYKSDVYMARIVGYATKADYRPMAKLIMESFRKAKTNDLNLQEYKQYYRKLQLKLYHKFEYSDNYWVALYCKILKFYQTIRNSRSPVLYPCKILYRTIKSFFFRYLQKK
jgi:glycosyltransferase involved in cell wall biosynthesis